MKPTIEDFLTGNARWYGEHQGIRYELSWHGRSDYSPEGTWCWYLLLSQEQFYPEDWETLRLKRQDRQFIGGDSWHRHWDYDSFPDLEPHGGWTFGNMSVFLGKDGKEYELVKVGCDYNHAWDRESGYWQGKSDIEADAKRSIGLLIGMFPRRRERCSYCGKWDDPEQFYTARNGARVHKSQQSKFSEEKWPGWLPAEAQAA